MARRLWTEEELIIVFGLYLKIPFGQMDKGNHEVKELAKIIDRTPDAVAIRLTNFAHLDPFHQNRGVKGMSGGANQCQPIWDAFNRDKEGFIFNMEKTLASRQGVKIEKKFSGIFSEFDELEGKTKERMVQVRLNQHVFRKRILSSYNSTCAISGIDIPELLVAGHIVPWSISKKERLNPQNGICLSKLYDSAFENGLIGIQPDYSILLSKDLKRHSEKGFYQRFFKEYEGEKISVPENTPPAKEFLEWHLEERFRIRN